MIVREGSKYSVKSESGKNMGTYDSEGQAKKRLMMIEWFKKKEAAGELKSKKGSK